MGLKLYASNRISFSENKRTIKILSSYLKNFKRLGYKNKKMVNQQTANNIRCELIKKTEDLINIIKARRIIATRHGAVVEVNFPITIKQTKIFRNLFNSPSNIDSEYIECILKNTRRHYRLNRITITLNCFYNFLNKLKKGYRKSAGFLILFFAFISALFGVLSFFSF